MKKLPPQKIPLLLERSAKWFRLGEYGQANQALIRSIRHIEANITIVDPQHIPSIQSLLEQALSAQQQKDHLYLADILEYELRPLFPVASNSLDKVK